jgi:hypothetical protein
MDDDVAGIDQSPVAGSGAGHGARAIAALFQPPRQVIGDSGNMAG